MLSCSWAPWTGPAAESLVLIRGTYQSHSAGLRLVPTHDCAIWWQSVISICCFHKRIFNWSTKSHWCLKSNALSSCQEDIQANKKIHEADFTPVCCSVYIGSSTNLSPRRTPLGASPAALYSPFLSKTSQGVWGCSGLEAWIWGYIRLVILITLICINRNLVVPNPPAPGTPSSIAAESHSFISGHINIWCFSQSLSSLSRVIMCAHQLVKVKSQVLATTLPFPEELKCHGKRSNTPYLRGKM